ncbi:MAG TPA: trigger factor [Candidatus Scatavimonas merdigallinarum]|uniref:Trigger factor n=1 Tax=Candidatus Scatavimonas merdigallinarum TaxID=2840914 RepID=A0A9D1CTI8_9FIRM|nr:trigger factor [Candidatus Scatavimonas merdigallinarum]
MSLKSSNKVDTNRYELEVQVDAETFEKAVSTVYRKKVKNINVPGFRKGKAPRMIIEKMYGEEIFYEDAMQDLYPEALSQAAEEAQLKLVRDKIDLDVISVGKEGFTFKATVTVEPEVEIENYKGIEIAKKTTEVTEEILEEEIQKIRERNSRLVTVEDRPAQNGDSVVIDFEGFVDGVAFEGGKAENYTLALGSGNFIPGFEEQIVGHNTNDAFTITVTFPEDYQVDDLKSKEAQFKIVLHEIKAKELPEFDNEFIKDISEKETVEEYKEELKSEVAQRLQKESEQDVENQLTTKLTELLKAEIPEAMYENTVDDMLREFDMRLRSQGMDMQTYMQYMGMDKDGLRAMYRPQAEQRVKLRLALDKIAQLENLTADDAAIEAEYERMAESYKMPVEKIKKIVSTADIAKDLAVEKAMDLVKDSAAIA